MSPKKMHTYLLGVLVVLVVITLAGLYFANLKLTNLATETSKLSADITVSEKQLDAYELTKFKVDSLDYVGELAERVVPESEEQSVVVAELSQFALRSRLTLAGIEFAEPAETNNSKDKKKSAVPKGVTVVPIIVKFNDARYERLLDFLRTIEGNRRKMQVNNISLKPNEEDRAILSEVTVAMNLYVKKAPSEKKQ